MQGSFFVNLLRFRIKDEGSLLRDIGNERKAGAKTCIETETKREGIWAWHTYWAFLLPEKLQFSGDTGVVGEGNAVLPCQGSLLLLGVREAERCSNQKTGAQASL